MDIDGSVSTVSDRSMQVRMCFGKEDSHVLKVLSHAFMIASSLSEVVRECGAVEPGSLTAQS